MKRKINKMVILKNAKNYIFLIIYLAIILISIVVYSNRVGIKYYWNKLFFYNKQTNNEKKEATPESKPISIVFRNWYIDVDLDDMNNLYKNIDLNNVFISGGIGEYNIDYEIKKDGYTSRMTYTVIDELGNSASNSQRINYVISRTNKNKALLEFYNIAKKYGYSVAYTNEDYKSGRFSKYVNGKYYRIIDVNNQRVQVSTINSQGLVSNNFCAYDIVSDYYNCMLDNSYIKYENYSELIKPMQDLLSEYNEIFNKYVEIGYGFEFLVAQIKN